MNKIEVFSAGYPFCEEAVLIERSVSHVRLVCTIFM